MNSERSRRGPGFRSSQTGLWTTSPGSGEQCSGGSSLARRVDFSRQTARFRFWNTHFSVLFGVCNADATGDATNATDATGTQRLPRPIGGDTTPVTGRVVELIRLFSETRAGRIQRDKICLGDEGEDATEIPIRDHSFTPLVNLIGPSPQRRRVPFVFRAWCELTATLRRKNGGGTSYPRKFACIPFMESSARRIGEAGSRKSLRAFYKTLKSMHYSSRADAAEAAWREMANSANEMRTFHPANDRPKRRQVASSQRTTRAVSRPFSKSAGLVGRA